MEPREYTVIIEQDEAGFYVGEVPELRSYYTQTRSVDELLERIKEVIHLCEEQQAEQTALRFVGVQ